MAKSESKIGLVKLIEWAKKELSSKAPGKVPMRRCCLWSR